MIIEDQSTKCPSCKNFLTWKSHEKIWTEGRVAALVKQSHTERTECRKLMEKAKNLVEITIRDLN